jgi:hypothetical protein
MALARLLRAAEALFADANWEREGIKQRKTLSLAACSSKFESLQVLVQLNSVVPVNPTNAKCAALALRAATAAVAPDTALNCARLDDSGF